ncbi:MAG: ABC transporter substrate-binding protein, partial [Solirubrobacteraceae bacterium]
MAGNGTAETMNPGHAVTPIDACRDWTLYEGLAWVNQSNKVVPVLAVDWAPSEGGMLWRFKLRRGVTFHNGKPFTADDVIYTIRSWGSST